MRIAIADALYDEETAWDVLDEIVLMFLSKKHIWEIGDPATVLSSAWVRSDAGGRAGSRIRTVAEKVFTDGAYRTQNARMHSSRRMIVRMLQNPATELAIGFAVDWLMTPVKVVVENGHSDGTFIGAVVHGFGRAKLSQAFDHRLWELEHAGGLTTIPRVIERLQALFKVPPRIFVLIDSGARKPGELLRDAKAIRKFCDANRIPVHVLRKREIENYLPDEVLSTLSERQTVFKALQELSSTQRDHYSMTLGFKPHRKSAKVPQEHGRLFDGVADAVLRDLVGGFGDDVSECFQSQRPLLTKQGMQRRCHPHPNELSEMLDRIESLI